MSVGCISTTLAMGLAVTLFFTTQVAASATGAQPPAGSAQGPDHLYYLRIPTNVSRAKVEAADTELKSRLHEYASARLKQDASNLPVDPTTDVIVIFTDSDGRPILPDRDARKRILNANGPKATTCPTNEITFTFNSPTYPWSVQDQVTLSNWLQTFYPVAKSVCGNPFFNITANLRKDPNISFAGLYYPSLNEMVVANTNSPDAVCHEMIHAFRDDYVMSLSSFEEGMTRMAEVEVFNRLPSYTHFDKNHGYEIDVFYEGMNRAAIGSKNGNLFAGYVSPFLRYQLSGYAWAKCLIENTNFLRWFNCDLYAQTSVDSTTPYTEAKLLAIATNVQSVVEGSDFLTWYHQQGVFNTDPPQGYFLFQRINQYTIDYFYRDFFGTETMQGTAPIHWAVLNHNNQLVDNGSGVTSGNGWIAFYPAGLSPGRIKVVCWTDTPSGTITNTALRPAGNTTGVFGVLAEFDSGTVTIKSINNSITSVTVAVTNGAFFAPSLATQKGSFLAEFRSETGAVISKRFTKDASDYYLELTGTPPQLTGMSLSNGVARFVLNGPAGSNYVIQVSSNLVNWLPISTNMIPSNRWLLITDPSLPKPSRRFYRAVP